METTKFEKKSPLFRRKVFILAWGGFCLYRETVNAQNGRWKQLCQINCDIAIIYLLLTLPKRSHSKRSWSCHLAGYSQKTWLITQTAVCVKCRGDQRIPFQRNVTMFCFQSANYFFHCSCVTLPVPQSSDQTTLCSLVYLFQGCCWKHS